MAWTTPRTWVAGETVTAALLNTHLRDQFDNLAAAWASFTPTIGGTGWAIGNGTAEARYKLLAGRTVVYDFRIEWGTTSTFGAGALSIGIPVTRVAVGVTAVCGTAALTDTSTGAQYAASAFIGSGGTTLSVTSHATTGTISTVPFTWASTDRVRGTVVYEGV